MESDVEQLKKTFFPKARQEVLDVTKRVTSDPSWNRWLVQSNVHDLLTSKYYFVDWAVNVGRSDMVVDNNYDSDYCPWMSSMAQECVDKSKCFSIHFDNDGKIIDEPAFAWTQGERKGSFGWTYSCSWLRPQDRRHKPVYYTLQVSWSKPISREMRQTWTHHFQQLLHSPRFYGNRPSEFDCYYYQTHRRSICSADFVPENVDCWGYYDWWICPALCYRQYPTTWNIRPGKHLRWMADEIKKQAKGLVSVAVGETGDKAPWAKAEGTCTVTGIECGYGTVAVAIQS